MGPPGRGASLRVQMQGFQGRSWRAVFRTCVPCPLGENGDKGASGEEEGGRELLEGVTGFPATRSGPPSPGEHLPLPGESGLQAFASCAQGDWSPAR